MKTGIAGAGSLGSLFASFFIRAGIDTLLYDISPDTVNCIKKELKIATSSDEYVFHPEISSDPTILSDADIIFLFVKSYSTPGAAESLAQVSKSDSIIVSLQNGLGNFELLQQKINPERIVYGTTTFGAAKKSPSEVIFGGKGTVNIGGSSEKAVSKVKDLLENSGCDVAVTDNPARTVWFKALINAGINPVASILGIKNGQILENTYAMQMQELILKEAVKAAQSIGLDFDFAGVLKETRKICSKTSANICSMLQDLNAGRKTEITSINMKIAETGEAAGLDMKHNRMISLIIQALEESGKKTKFMSKRIII